MANEMRARVAARKDKREAMSMTVRCCDNEKINAIRETPHAILSNMKDKGNTCSELTGTGGAG